MFGGFPFGTGYFGQAVPLDVETDIPEILFASDVRVDVSAALDCRVDASQGLGVLVEVSKATHILVEP